MATVYVTAYVPAAAVATAEAAVLPYLAGPGAVFTVPLNASGLQSDPATHYGTCAAVSDAGQLYAALPSLKAALGGDYAVVSPWRSFRAATHWHGWLLARGLRAILPPAPDGV